MPKSLLQTAPLGPFDGVVDTRNPSLLLPGKLRNMQNFQFKGVNELMIRRGTALALTLYDDQVTPAVVTRVLYVGTFMDGGIAIAHSTVTSKVYLYRMPSTMDGWYDSTGAAKTTLLPEPCAVLWTAVTDPPDVSTAEGLGMLYVGNTIAVDAGGVYFPTKTVTFDPSTGVPTVASLAASGTDGSSAGADTAYFTHVVSFHQALFGLGYGAGSTAGYTSYRPELLRFSPPNFGNLQEADSIVLGDRVRALRERGVNMVVVGNALFILGSETLFRVTGYGRDSWYVETLSTIYGATGPKAAVAVQAETDGGTSNALYWMSANGPMRCQEGGQPEPLWDAVAATVATIANPSQIVAAYDVSTNLVWFTYDSGSGIRTLCTFDVRRNAFTSTNGDTGLVIHCAGVVDPIYASTATPPAAPAVPVIVGTSAIATTSAIFTWTEATDGASIEIGIQVSGAPSWSVLWTTEPGATTYTATGLLAATHYQWRARAVKNGIYSSYTAGEAFVTAGTSSGPAAPTGLTAVPHAVTGTTVIDLEWTNTVPADTTQVLRSTDGVTFAQVATVAAGTALYSDDPGAYGTFYYEVRHVGTGGTVGSVSAYASATTRAH